MGATITLLAMISSAGHAQSNPGGSPKVALTGIVGFVKPPRAFLEIEVQPGQPARKVTLREGERDGAIELVAIDSARNRVRIRNAGVEQELGFVAAQSPVAPPPRVSPPPVARPVSPIIVGETVNSPPPSADVTVIPRSPYLRPRPATLPGLLPQPMLPPNLPNAAQSHQERPAAPAPVPQQSFPEAPERTLPTREQRFVDYEGLERERLAEIMRRARTERGQLPRPSIAEAPIVPPPAVSYEVRRSYPVPAARVLSDQLSRELPYPLVYPRSDQVDYLRRQRILRWHTSP